MLLFKVLYVFINVLQYTLYILNLYFEFIAKASSVEDIALRQSVLTAGSTTNMSQPPRSFDEIVFRRE